MRQRCDKKNRYLAIWEEFCPNCAALHGVLGGPHDSEDLHETLRQLRQFNQHAANLPLTARYSNDLLHRFPGENYLKLVEKTPLGMSAVGSDLRLI